MSTLADVTSLSFAVPSIATTLTDSSVCCSHPMRRAYDHARPRTATSLSLSSHDHATHLPEPSQASSLRCDVSFPVTSRHRRATCRADTRTGHIDPVRQDCPSMARPLRQAEPVRVLTNRLLSSRHAETGTSTQRRATCRPLPLHDQRLPKPMRLFGASRFPPSHVRATSLDSSFHIDTSHGHATSLDQPRLCDEPLRDPVWPHPCDYSIQPAITQSIVTSPDMPIRCDMSSRSKPASCHRVAQLGHLHRMRGGP